MIKKLAVITITLLALIACQTIPKTTKNDEFSVSAQVFSQLLIQFYAQQQSIDIDSADYHRKECLKRTRALHFRSHSYLSEKLSIEEMQQLNKLFDSRKFVDLILRKKEMLHSDDLSNVDKQTRDLAIQLMDNGVLRKYFDNYYLAIDRNLNHKENLMEYLTMVDFRFSTNQRLGICGFLA